MPEITDYTVGWICAISAEYVAAQEFLDEEHPPLSEQHPNDDNLYTLGTISKHNVVIACLPDASYGTNSAVAVARDLLRTFPNIKFGLMVGIGGGCPSRKRDIRLGDVVVSSVSSNQGAVLQYDFGKAIQDNEFKLTKHLDAPPRLLAAAVQDLRALHKRRGNGLDETVASALQKNRRLKREFARPPVASDRLFQSTLRHTHPEEACDSTCALQEDQLILREDRNGDEDDIATVHYGLIASGNSLIKSAELRDQLVAEKDVLCFEMEAAGLMDHFKCLVIRGICDYCDTHKNDDWQGYAAMVAAAYAKDLLGRIPPSKVDGEQSMKLSEISRETQQIKSLAAETKDRVAELAARSQAKEVQEWLSPPDPSTDFLEALKQRHAHTGMWFLESKKYNDWKTTPHAFLWLHARPGAGKTVLASTIIEDLQASRTEVPTVLYFYFSFSNSSKQTLQSMLSSLVYQLYTSMPATQELVHARKGSSAPSIAVLSSLFKDMIRKIGSASIALDALDECPQRGGANRELIAWIKDCRTWETDLRILATSRYENHIRSQFINWAESLETLELAPRDMDNDIASYVHYAVREHDGLKRWREREDVQNEIEESLAKKADGMFRWVSCQLTVLESCRDLLTLRRAMKKLPRTLNETYLRILNTIPEEDRPYTFRILQLLAYSEKPIELDAMIDALAVEIGQEPAFTEEHRMEDREEIVAYFSGLARVVHSRDQTYASDVYKYEVQLAHFSVREWLVGDATTGPVFDEFSTRESICMVYLSYSCEVDHLCLNTKDGGRYKLFERGGLFNRNGHFATYAPARPLTSIAEMNWVDHARFIANRSPDVRAKAAELLQRRGPIFDPNLQFLGSKHDQFSSWRRQDMPYDIMLAYALVQACHHGLPAIADALIQRGASPDGHAECLRTPLQAAAAGGSLEVVQLLVNNYEVGLNDFCRREVPSTALAIACRKEHRAIVQFLLDRGADPNARREPALRTPIKITAPWIVGDEQYNHALDQVEVEHYASIPPLQVAAAARSSTSQVVSLLIDFGADVNMRLSESGPISTWQRGPLEVACSRRSTKLAALLLRHGAQLDPIDNYRDALSVALPLNPFAVAGDVISIFSVLLEHAAAINWYGIHNWSAIVLGYACAWCKEIKAPLELCGMALQYGLDINAVAYGPFTALQHACGRPENPRTISLVSLLLSNGADVNARGSFRQPTPLQRACQAGSSELVALLLAHSADPNLGGSGGKALHFACKAEQGPNAEIIKGLLRSGADINAGDGSENGTPLVVACQQSHLNVQIVQLLLENEANVQARGSDGSTALQHACYYSGNLKIIGALLDSNADCKASSGDHGSALRVAAFFQDLDLFEMLLGCYADDEEEAEECRQAWLRIDGIDESDESPESEADEVIECESDGSFEYEYNESLGSEYN